jgi:MFS family permease
VNQLPTGRLRRRPFFGWWIVTGTTTTFAVQSAAFILTFGSYLLEVQEEFGWSKSVLSAAFSLSQLMSGLMGPGQGWMIDRFGPRLVMRIGVVMMGAAFMLLSVVDDLWFFYAIVLLIGLGGNLGGFLTMNTAIANWFVRRRALALGLASTGLGAGGFLAPIVTWSLVEYGWRPTAFGTGVVIILLGLPIAQFMRSRPEDYGMKPDGASLSDEESSSLPSYASDIDFTPREAMRDRSFWLLSTGHGMALATVFVVLVHLVPHVVETYGWSKTSAQAMVAVVTTASVAGQIGGGILGDRFSKSRIAATCMIGHFIALMLLAFGGSAGVAPAAVIHGLSWGARGPLMMAIRADYYGRRNYGTIMGYSMVIVMLGPVIGPVIGGVLSDQFGGYTEAFTIIGVATGLASISFLMARKPPAPNRSMSKTRSDQTE